MCLCLLRKSDSPKVRFSDPQILRKSDSQILRKSDSQVLQKPDPPKVRFSDSPKVRFSDSPKVRFSDSPKVRFSDSPKSDSQILRKSDSQILRCHIWATILTYANYTVLQKYADVGLNENLFRSTTLDIITRLLDNAAFVCVHLVRRFSKDFLEMRVLRSRGFQI